MRTTKTWALWGLMALGLANMTHAADGAVLIQNGEIKITQDDFLSVVNALVPEDKRAEFLKDDRRMREMLADYFTIRVLSSEAVAAGLDKQPEFVARQRYESQRALSQLLLAKLSSDAKHPSPDAIEKKAKEFYLANPEKFVIPEKVRVKHILVAPKDDRTEQQMLERAEQALAELRKEGANFEAIAKQYSDDPSVTRNGGDLGFVLRSKLVEDFAKVAFAMKQPGELSQPVKTQFGYHIIQFVDRKSEERLSFDQAKAGLIEQEVNKFETAIRERKLRDVQSSPDIKVNEEALRALIGG